MKIRLLIPGLLVSVPAFAWQPQTGDIIFQISRSSQSKAIQLATHSDYSHTGMLVIRNKKPYVFEAVGPVKYTPLKQWIAHGEKGKYVVRRVEGGLSVEQQQKLAQTAKRYLGKPVRFQLLVERRSPVLFGSGLEGLSERAGNARGQTAKVERVRP
ncbi:putative peptidoglycan peptidase [Escherichia coli]|uniref:Putative peptidoglycan peptidase n=1 Tax=Escherichia coli TaxID=562 RepID=A0A377DE01_ECOLX|nr:putative peptidoglycan peptidase [Escherichia coli]